MREKNRKKTKSTSFVLDNYPVYIIDTWSVLAINNPTLMSICQL